jgi:hypothetical protein
MALSLVVNDEEGGRTVCSMAMKARSVNLPKMSLQALSGCTRSETGPLNCTGG